MANERCPIVIPVLGMHRSGTSTVSRAINALGVDLGRDIIGPHPDNPKGLWENWLFVNINERLLENLGLKWHSVCLIEDDFLNTAATTALSLEARSQVLTEFAGIGCWGFKDPRTPRLLPFWQRVLGDIGADVRYVLALRHPLSVARSLVKREGFSLEKGLLLWLLHTIPAVVQTVGQPRVVVDYDRLFENPRRELIRISERLGLPEPQPVDLKAYEEEFLDPSLRHTIFHEADLEGVVGGDDLSVQLYSLLRQVAADEIDIDSFQERVQEMWQVLRAQRIVYNYAKLVDEELAKKDEELAKRDEELQRVKEEALLEQKQLEVQISGLGNRLNSIYQSDGWKLLSKYYRLRDTIVPSSLITSARQAKSKARDYHRDKE